MRLTISLLSLALASVLACSSDDSPSGEEVGASETQAADTSAGESDEESSSSGSGTEDDDGDPSTDTSSGDGDGDTDSSTDTTTGDTDTDTDSTDTTTGDTDSTDTTTGDTDTDSTDTTTDTESETGMPPEYYGDCPNKQNDECVDLEVCVIDNIDGWTTCATPCQSNDDCPDAGGLPVTCIHINANLFEPKRCYIDCSDAVCPGSMECESENAGIDDICVYK